MRTIRKPIRYWLGVLFLLACSLLQAQNIPGSIANACPVRTASLSAITPQNGNTLEWHTVSSNPTASTRINTPSSVGAGVYYLFALSNGVYSLVGQTQVSLVECTPQPAFSCPATAFFVQDSPSDFYSLDLSTGAFVLEKNNIIASGSNRQIQAIGYNPLDGYIYGYRSGTTDLVRIGSDYSYQLLSISGLPVSGYDNGDIDSQGILYLTNGGNTIRRIDLNPNSPTYLQKLPDLSTTGTTISDWAINPVDGFLYAVNQSAVLYRYNRATGARTTVGTIQWPVSSSNGFGGVFFDAGGNLYLFDNNTGQTLKVASTQTLATNAANVIQGSLFLSTGVPVTASDAARCQSAPVPCPPVGVAGFVTSQPTCQVATGTVTVTGFGSGFSYRLIPGGNYQSSSVFSSVLPGSYMVQVQEIASGCVTATALVGINTAPTVPTAPVLTASSPTICVGASTMLNAAGCGGTLLWSTGQNQSSIQVSPTTSMTFTATCTENNCTSPVAWVAVTVSPIPSAPTLTASPAAICPGTSSVLSAAGCAGTVNWLTGQQGSSITVAPSASGTYTFTATCSENTCVSTAGSVVLTVKPDPGSPSLSPSAPVLCAGQSVDLTATGCVAGATVRWLSGEVGETITVSPATTTLYRAVCELDGCQSLAISAVEVTVNPKPAPPVLSAISASICAGASTQLSAAGCSGMINWSTGQAGTVTTLQSETLIISAGFSNTVTSYTMVCVENSCVSDPAVGSITYLQIPDVPVITADGPTVGVCEGSRVSLRVPSCSGGNVNWSNGLSGESVILFAQPGQSYSVRCFNGSCGSPARPILFQRP